MRITDVKVEPVELRGQLCFSRGTTLASPRSRVGALLRIVTDGGLEGVALSRSGQVLADPVVSLLAARLVGRDAFTRERLWEHFVEVDRQERVPVPLLGLVDVALWDLAGRAAGVPVHKLLGGYRERISAYASLGAFASVAEHLDVVDQCLELGFTAVKLRGWADSRRDAELCLAVRDHVGGRAVLIYDGSASFDLPEAVHVGRALTEANYLWFAEPLRAAGVSTHRWLADRIDVPLLVAGVAEGPEPTVADFVASGCAEYVHTGEAHRSGITGALRVAQVAEAFLVRAEVPGSGLLAAHLCMALPNVTYYESLVLTNPVVREVGIGVDGKLRAPTGVGMGYDLTG